MSVLTRQYKPKNKAPWEKHVPSKPKPPAMRPPAIQAKLTVGRPNDMYEQEADRLADRVMRMTDESLVQPKSGCSGCEEEELIQTKPLADQITPLVQRQSPADEEEMLQAKSTSPQPPGITPNIESSINSMKGGGQTLSPSTRSFFESRFGTDFSHVRVHTDGKAAQTAQSVNAKAYTTGNNIAFNHGQYSPKTTSGKRLLAHELTHVMQQGGKRGQATGTTGALTISRKQDNINEPPPDSGNGEYHHYVFKIDRVDDHKNEGLMLQEFQRLFSVSKAEAKLVVVKLGWENNEGILTVEKYIEALRMLYGGSGNPMVEKSLTWFQKEFPKNQHTIRYFPPFSRIVKFLSVMSPIQYKYFIRWYTKTYPNNPPLKEATVEEAKKISEIFKEFIVNKTELLAETRLLEEYRQENDIPAQYNFQDLKDKVFKLDENEISETNIAGDLPVTDLLVEYFKERALAKVMELLAITFRIVDSEKKRYTDQKEQDKLTALLTGKYGDKFSEANQLRIKEFQQFAKKYKMEPMDFLESKGPELILNLLLGQKNNEKKLDDLLRIIKPGELQKLLICCYNNFTRQSPTLFSELNGGEVAETTVDEKQIESEFPGFKEADQMDVDTYNKMRMVATKQFPILADISTDFRRLAKKPKESIMEKINHILEQKEKNAQKTKNELLQNPNLIWSLVPLIEMVMKDLAIEKSDNIGKIVWGKVQDAEDFEFWRSIALSALGIALGIAGVFSGGSAWVVGGLLAGSAVVSGVDVYFELKSYQFHSAAANATFWDELDNSPSSMGIAFAILGFVTDAFDLIKHGGKVIGKIVNKIKAAKKEDIEKEVANAYDELHNISELEKKIGEKSDFVKSITEEALKFRIKKNTNIEEFTRLRKEILGEMESPITVKYSLFRVFKDADENTYRRIMTAFANSPDSLKRLSFYILNNPEVVYDLQRISNLLGDNSTWVFQYLGKQSEMVFETLPEVTKLIVKGNITEKGLIQEILTHHKLQIAITHIRKQPGKMNTLWKDYLEKKRQGVTYDFSSYVGYRGIKTVPNKVDMITVNDFLARRGLQKNASKETKLLNILKGNEEMLAYVFKKGKLPPAVAKNLDVLFQKFKLNEKSLLTNTRKRLIKKINITIGNSVRSFEDYKIVMSFLRKSPNKGALGEAFARNFNIPDGAKKGKKTSINVKKQTIIIDNLIHTKSSQRIVEVKTGASYDPKQLELYLDLIKNQKKHAKNASKSGMGKQKNIKRIDGITYVFLPGAEDFKKMSKGAGNGGKDLVKARAETMWEIVLASKNQKTIEVHFVTTDGTYYVFKNNRKPTKMKKTW